MDNLEAILGSSFSVDTAENINHEMGQMAGEFLLDPPKPKPGSEEKILVASADCKGVPLVKEDAEKVAAFEQRKTNPGNRRMATAASVYSIAPHMRTAEEIADALFREEHDCNTELSERPKPANKNTTAHFPDKMENGDGTEVAFTGIEMAVSWISLKVDARRRKNQRMVVLMDGQEALWNAFSSHTPFDEKTIPILDIIHALTYIWAASELSRKTMQAVRYSHVLD